MGNKHKNEDSYVLNFVSKKLDRMTADIPAVRVESRQKTGHRRLKLSLSLIPACLLILVIFANIVLLERRAQQQQTFNSLSGKCSLDNLVLGISISAVNRKFLSLGGTKHWFHLTERLILNIDRIIKFRKKVASLKGRDDKVIYIIFDQKYDVENLGPFGRLLFVSLVSGGRTPNKEPIFERIIFGYSSLKKVMHSAETVAKNMSAEAHEFHPHHIVDLRSQDINSMFVKSADGMITSSSSYTMSLCVQKLSHLSLEKVDKKLEWFNSKLYRFRLFHDWVCHTCDTAGQSSDSDFQPKISSYSERFRIKSAFRSQQENIKQSLSSNLSYEELLDISDDLNVGNGELQIKITGAAWANKKAGINLEPSPIIKTDTSANLTVLMYQRDASRRLVNMNTAMKRMGTLLGSRWTIKTIFHSDDLSPCTIINPIRKATVLITPHGFQSILLLFQPLSSVLVEVHPAFYLKQEVYGFIQAGLRQNFKLARSYLAEESIPVHFVTRSVARVLYFFRFSTHDCLHNAVCRNIARRQDVMISEAFMERIAIFISSHFTFGQK